MILRQKALLGETYIELTPGDKSGGHAGRRGTLSFKATQEAVQIDELVRTFDRPTRRAFQGWIRELAGAIEKGRGEDLNNAIGNLPDFVATGDDVLAVLDDQRPALKALIRNSGRTLEAVNEREGQLRQLVVNGDRFFGALASRNEALADTVFVLPTFLDETRLTVRRLRRFSVNARPLVRDLQPVATDLQAHAARRGPAGARPAGAVPRSGPADRRVRGHAAGAPPASCAEPSRCSRACTATCRS